MSIANTLNNINPILIIPFSDPSIDFKSNKLSLDKPLYDNSFNYTHVGNYVVKASSFADDSTAPYNAFNNFSSKYWQTDFSGNSEFGKSKLVDVNYTEYSQDPYSNSHVANSSYRGGGDEQSNLFSTKVGSTAISGEWLQIQLPKDTPIFLYKYAILTPIPSGGISSFPSKFMLVGSNDETNWELVDNQNIEQKIDTTDQTPVFFNVNVTNGYTYYRLIISEMFKENSVLRISQFVLYGTPKQVVNKDAFTNMDAGPVFIPFSRDIFRPYVDYKTSQPLNSFDTNKKTEAYILQDSVRTIPGSWSSDMVLPSALFTILAISFALYLNKK
jgi:hypothetical protein